MRLLLQDVLVWGKQLAQIAETRYSLPVTLNQLHCELKKEVLETCNQKFVHFNEGGGREVWTGLKGVT